MVAPHCGFGMMLSPLRCGVGAVDGLMKDGLMRRVGRASVGMKGPPGQWFAEPGIWAVDWEVGRLPAKRILYVSELDRVERTLSVVVGPNRYFQAIRRFLR